MDHRNTAFEQRLEALPSGKYLRPCKSEPMSPPASCSYCAVYCQGITSSSQAGTYFSIRRARRMPSLQRDMADVINGERNFRADDVTDLGNVLFKKVQPFLCEVEAGEGMAHVVRVIGGVARGAPPACAPCRPSGWRRKPSSVPTGATTAPGKSHDLAEAEIHLQESDSRVPCAPSGACRSPCRSACCASVSQYMRDAVAELAAKHLVDRDAVGLAGKIPQRDLDRRDAAALPAVSAELLDPRGTAGRCRTGSRRAAGSSTSAHRSRWRRHALRRDRRFPGWCRSSTSAEVNGAPTISATRMSVMRSSDGLEDELTRLSASSAQSNFGITAFSLSRFLCPHD